MNYFFLLIILLVLFEFYLRSKKKSDIKYENIKRVPSLNLERSYKIKSNTGHLQNSKKSKILGWDLVENSHINEKEWRYEIKFIVNYEQENETSEMKDCPGSSFMNQEGESLKSQIASRIPFMNKGICVF